MADRLLILGLPRTGTQSLTDGLESIGHARIYHMSEVPANPGHAAKWLQLLQRKMQSPETPLTAADFDPILAAYPGGLSDFPASIFGVDLIRAYPSAKVLITTREEDGWVDSVMRTLVAGHREYEAERVAREERGETFTQEEDDRRALRRAYHEYCWNDDFPTYGRDYWRKYQEAIKTAAEENRAKEDVLVYNPSEGWGPLCEFVGLDVPKDVPFPHVGNKANWATK